MSTLNLIFKPFKMQIYLHDIYFIYMTNLFEDWWGSCHHVLILYLQLNWKTVLGKSTVLWGVRKFEV